MDGFVGLLLTAFGALIWLGIQLAFTALFVYTMVCLPVGGC